MGAPAAQGGRGSEATDHQAPVWAGWAVNYATKCAQEAAAWCKLHGSDFVAAVLEGEQRRPDTKSLRAQETQLQRTRIA